VIITNYQPAPTSEDIKASTTIPDVAASLYPKWQPTKSCRSPFRPDRSPSFSVFDEGRRWHDFAEGKGGDVLDFVMRALGCPFEEAVKYLGGVTDHQQQFSGRVERTPGRSRPTRHWPSLRKPSQTDLEKIAKTRGLSVQGLELAVSHGLLWVAPYYGFTSWVVTDSERRAGSFRRMDGRPWKDGRKALFLQGSESAYPIGLREIINFPAVLLTEGAPDLLAAFHCIHDAGIEGRVTAASILSASVRQIPDLCLPSFTGKVVRIFAHGDTPGQEAGERWAKQLKAVTARVDVFSFDGFSTADDEAVTDLNELVRLRVSPNNILGGLGR
jgi:CHC2 zinc finger